MRFAASIKYGGQLIEAIDCDYNSYKHLGLLCPECKNPVFLREGHTRITPKSKQEVKVEPAFAHFKAQDPAQVLACENRVAHYDRKELEKRATVARNQRLKLLQRWFWSIFWRRLELDRNFKSAEQKEKFQRDLPTVAPILCANEQSLCELLESLPQLHDQRYKQCEMCINAAKKLDKNDVSSDRVIQTLQFISSVDRQMQAMICTEVLDFLFSKSNRCLLFQVLSVFFLIAVDSKTRTEKLLQNYGSLANAIYAELILEVCWTDWAGEFERLKTQ